MENRHGSRVLETQRLILRPLCVEDAEEAFNAWTNDPEVPRYMRWSPHKDINETLEFLEECEKKYPNADYYHWGIVIRETGKLIGTIGAFPNEHEPSLCEPGYCIAKKYWGNGYTTEALRRIMDYLVHDEGLRHFICLHAKENPASGAVMLHAGFVYKNDGTYKSFDGQRVFESRVYYLDAEP